MSEQYGEISEEAVEKEMKFLIDNLKKNILNIKTKGLQQAIYNAEKQGQKDLCEGLLKELTALRNESLS